MKNISASIVSIGTELLLGEIVNTNSQYLSVELAKLGIDVYEHRTIGDNRERLLECFDSLLGKYDMVITTGGLGPTVDDISKETACEFFGMEMKVIEHELTVLREIFRRYGRVMTENNNKQAMFPADAVILKNPAGSAPGCILEKNGKRIILLPGPPDEMKLMYDNEAVPHLMKLTGSVLHSEVVKVCGIGESAMEEMVIDIINSSSNPTVAPYAKTGECRLRVTAKAQNLEMAEKLTAPVVKKLVERLGDNVYTVGDDTLAQTVAKILGEMKFTISGAESCTGGMTASMLVDCPGISAVFKESFVTYSNDSKIRNLGVSLKTLEKYGAVSEQCASEMAEGCARKSGSDVAYSITGIAGPDGGSAEKPAGTVCLGFFFKGTTVTKTISLHGSRNVIRTRASIYMLDMIRRELLKFRIGGFVS